MDHLNRSGNKWDPTDPDGGVTLRIGFPQEYDDIPLYFRNMDGFDTPVDAWAKGLDFFDAQNQDYALQALQAWADMAKVRFEVVAPARKPTSISTAAISTTAARSRPASMRRTAAASPSTSRTAGRTCSPPGHRPTC
jgi:hypothetical protein